MNTRHLTAALSLVLILAAGALSAGCKAASCEKVCETMNGCSGATQVADCQASCDADRKAADEAGCASEYDARMNCLGTLDSCATQSFCAGQDAAYLTCLSNSTGTSSGTGGAGGAGTTSSTSTTSSTK